MGNTVQYPALDRTCGLQCGTPFNIDPDPPSAVGFFKRSGKFGQGEVRQTVIQRRGLRLGVMKFEVDVVVPENLEDWDNQDAYAYHVTLEEPLVVNVVGAFRIVIANRAYVVNRPIRSLHSPPFPWALGMPSSGVSFGFILVHSHRPTTWGSAVIPVLALHCRIKPYISSNYLFSSTASVICGPFRIWMPLYPILGPASSHPPASLSRELAS
ncbi:hypothetical protein B0H14DRAFT_2598622 [Mycena olivaceomarginata]|nr:hypothetical protein B0H14DRAFT_2598622 [Mycena olivaceomarginata]